MNIIVLTKYVPERSGRPPEIGPDFRLRRESGDGGLDPVDEPGIALARELADRSQGVVTALSMGPERARSALQRALATGADRAVLVTDEALASADALLTAKVLAGAISRETWDLVIAGVESSAGGTGTMPMTLAELLGIPSATFARRVSVSDGTLVIERPTDVGYDTIECPLPALLTVTTSVASARLPSAREMIAARRKPVEQLSLADLHLEPGSRPRGQTVTAIDLAPERQAGELIEDAAKGSARIVEALRAAVGV